MKNNYISEHHSFDIYLAEEFGIEEAILIHHFQHWISINRRMKKNLIEGRTWTYQTQEWICAHFPYFNNRKKVNRLINSLIEKGVLIKDSFNKSKYDQTLWYAFKDEDRFLSKKEGQKTEKTPVSGESGKKCPMNWQKVSNEVEKSVPPIPDTKNIYLKEKESKKEKVADAPFDADASGAKAPRTPLISKENKIKRRENVFTTNDEHDRLANDYGLEKTEKFYSRLQDWKECSPKSKWKKFDYRSIIRWVVAAVHEDSLKEEKLKKQGNTEGNVAHAKKIAHEFNAIVAPKKYIRLDALDDQIIILTIHPTCTKNPTVIKYREEGFRDKLKQAMHKWKLI